MSGDFLLDWSTLVVSLFNTILLLWLGLTVLLNAERRSWGTWLAVSALLAGFLFFLSHTILLGYGLELPAAGLNFWWQLGWLPLIWIPLAWYATILWYSSHWQFGEASASQMRRTSFWLILVIALFITGALLLASPLPSADQLIQYDLTATPSWHGFPVLVLFFPLYALLCTGLSIEALLHPAPAQRVMGEYARQRARPWLVGSSALLLLISLLVVWVVGWLVFYVYAHPFTRQVIRTLIWFDLLIATLIATTILFVGQAVVSYEIFTGKILPRKGLVRFWRMAILLAVSFSLVMGWGTLVSLRPIYILLLNAGLVGFLLALLGWRSYTERERSIENLRPFVTSQRLYEHMVSQSNEFSPSIEIHLPFQVLCAQVLDAKKALLVPLRQFSALVGSPSAYPLDDHPEVPDLDGLLAQMNDSRPLCLPFTSRSASDLRWAVPLWNERGLTGFLFLGEKSHGSLYTQEDIEIARAVGERLIDIQASTEMARRLMALQRQHLAESQVLDRRARRSLHDDILPELHSAILSLGAPANVDPQVAEVVASLSKLHGKIADLLHDLPAAIEPEISRLGLLGALQQTLEREFKNDFDQVYWNISENAEQKSLVLPGMQSEVYFYAAREAIRNAAHHGRGAGHNQPLQVTLKVAWDGGLQMMIEDNGIGLQTTPSEDGTLGSPGSGRGLALHSTLMAVIGGSLTLESSPGDYTRVILFLPESQA